MKTSTNDTLVAWWAFDALEDAKALDQCSGLMDRIEGRYKRVDGVVGTALKLDGFTTAVVREAPQAPVLSGAFTIEAWIAIGAYPWNFCAIAAQRRGETAGYDFAVGPRGEVRLCIATADRWITCASGDFSIPLRTWTHIACTCGTDGAMAVYVNGQPAGSADAGAAPAFAPEADLWIGANAEAVRPAYHRGKGGTQPSWFCLDGMLDELKIYQRALAPEEIAAAHGAVTPAPQHELMPRRMPSGPPGPGRFGATYCTLNYYDEWDAIWPVGPDADVLVRFDTSPARVVFWRGIRYSPVWVSENDLWMADQSVEAWDDVEGCYEHMQDRHCNYSHVRVIESTDARVVVHWRYAPTSSHDHHWKVDPKTGWGCWVDEYYFIYPDAMCIRKVMWKRGTLGPQRQFQESLPLSHPGQVQGDIVEREYVTIANLDNQTATLCYTETPGPSDPKDLPGNPLIQRYNFKSHWRPFIIFEDGNTMGCFANKPLENLKKPGTCNHWPVCQVRSDGRDSQATDRPAHFLGFPISDPPIHQDGDTNWYGSLYGMTDQPMTRLVEIARSWNHPAELTEVKGPFAYARYDRGQRAFILTRREPDPAPLHFRLVATEKSPAFNPAIVVEGWGGNEACVAVDGQPAQRGQDYRTGLSYRLDRTDLVVWVRLQATAPVELTITQARNGNPRSL
jgi:hypothetical protein